MCIRDRVLSFNPSGRAEQYIGRQGSYGKLLYNSGLPAGKVACLLPFQEMCIRDSSQSYQQGFEEEQNRSSCRY